jgi:LmbE family N-acetylglucosaminyl deacetylase
MNASLIILLAIVGQTSPAAKPPLGTISGAAVVSPFDILVIAPHSDDEAIGCTGVILRAVARGQRVGVIVVTAGDGFPKAAAAAAGKSIEALTPQDFVDLSTMRQRHTLSAMREIGVRPNDVYFLGYPDGGMKALFAMAGESPPEPRNVPPYRQPHTGRSETYGTAVADYHTRRHGRAAPYRKQAVVEDLREIIADARPREIYVTHEIDTHPDHAALFRFVRDAATTAHFQGRLLTFVVHGIEPQEPPTKRIALTADELAKKRRTIEIYQVGVSPVHDRLAEQYAKPEERFWDAK